MRPFLISVQNPEDAIKEHISVCICTYRRNQMLERLLRNLALQETDGLFDFSVVVVDNDAAGPAKETVMRLRAELGLDFTYGIEPEQTIPPARNHALRLARDVFRVIRFYRPREGGWGRVHTVKTVFRTENSLKHNGWF